MKNYKLDKNVHVHGNCSQQVSIQRESAKVTNFRVSSKYKRLVMSTRYKRSPYTARVMLRPATTLREATLKQVHQTVQKEMHTICSRKYGDSVLRLNSIAAVTQFSWKPFLQELKKQAPTLYSFIRSAVAKRQCNTSHFALGMNASILLKHRNKHLALAQAVTSVIMYSGHGSKQVSSCRYMSMRTCRHKSIFAMQVFHRLNRLGVCLSHSRTMQLVKWLGEDHDAEVKSWRQAIELLHTEEALVESSPDAESYTTDTSEEDLLLMSATGLQIIQ